MDVPGGDHEPADLRPVLDFEREAELFGPVELSVGLTAVGGQAAIRAHGGGAGGTQETDAVVRLAVAQAFVPAAAVTGLWFSHPG